GAAAAVEGGEVVAGPFLVGAAPAVGGERAVDEAGEALGGGGRCQAEALQRLRPEVGDEDVGAVEQPVEDAPAGVGGDVDGQRPLAPVGGHEGAVGGVGVGPQRSPDGPHGVAAGGFDLDDVGPPIGQDAADGG